MPPKLFIRLANLQEGATIWGTPIVTSTDNAAFAGGMFCHFAGIWMMSIMRFYIREPFAFLPLLL